MTDTLLSIAAVETGLTSLPVGFQMRPATHADLEAAVKVMNAWSLQALNREKFILEEVRSEWQEPGYDLNSDSRVIVDPHSRIVGYEEVFDPGHPHARLHCWGVVDPQFANIGLEEQLLAWAEMRGRLAIESAPPEARVVLVAHCLTSQTATQAVFESQGFEFLRHALRMVIELEVDPDQPQWPAGISVRSMRPGQEERAVIQAVREAFQDHWGFIESPFEEEYARWQHLMKNHPHFDPDLWFLAFDGDQIAGISLCWPVTHDEHEMGWVGTLGVRRPWRRRGLAMALLQHSFGELWKRGKRKVGLGVDAQSLTGATRLYEKAGMRSDMERQISIFEKELRPGEELSTQSLEF